MCCLDLHIPEFVEKLKKQKIKIKKGVTRDIPAFPEQIEAINLYPDFIDQLISLNNKEILKLFVLNKKDFFYDYLRSKLIFLRSPAYKDSLILADSFSLPTLDLENSTFFKSDYPIINYKNPIKKYIVDNLIPLLYNARHGLIYYEMRFKLAGSYSIFITDEIKKIKSDFCELWHTIHRFINKPFNLLYAK